MATTQSKFAGWSYDFEVSKPGARSRRGADSLVLTRKEDGLQVKAGTSLLCNNVYDDEGLPIVVLIKEAVLGTAGFIDLFGVGFLRLSEVKNQPEDADPNELFITSVEDKIFVRDIIQEVQILNEEDFSKVTIDSSNQDSTFLCRRGYDTYFGSFSNVIDFKKIRDAFENDPANAMDSLRNITVKKIYNTKTPAPTIKKETKPATRKSSKPPAKRVSRTEKKVVKKKKGLTEHIISDDSDSEDGVNYAESDSDDAKDEHLFVSDGSDDNDDDGSDAVPDDDEFGITISKGRRSTYNKRPKLKGPRTLAVSSDLPKKVRDIIGDLSETAQETIASLPCREEQFSEIFASLESNIELEQGASYYISGPPGTGKTVTVRQVVRQLFRSVKENNLNNFDYVEINGMKLLNPQAAYEILWKKISNGQNVPATNLSSSLESYFKNGESSVPIIVLLDELDTIASRNQSILYNFFNWPTYEKSKLIVIAVANTMDLPERILSNKTSSRVGSARFQFPGYTHEDLVKIIKSKLEILNQEGITIKQDSIEFAARKVASVSGDARRALKIVKRAVQLAKQASENTGITQVQPVHINRAINEATNSPVSSYITSLSFVGKLILVGIYSRKSKSGIAENSLGDVIDEIKQIVAINSAAKNSAVVANGETFLEILYNDFVIRPDGFRYVLNELTEAGIILLSNNKSERNSLVKLNIADDEIVSIFRKDPSLQFFANLVT